MDSVWTSWHKSTASVQQKKITMVGSELVMWELLNPLTAVFLEKNKKHIRILSKFWCWDGAGTWSNSNYSFILPYITVTSQWARWHLKSPASHLFTQPYVPVHIKEKNHSPASLAFVRGIHRWPVNSPHKVPVTRKIFPFDDVIIYLAAAIIVCDTNQITPVYSSIPLLSLI